MFNLYKKLKKNTITFTEKYKASTSRTSWKNQASFKIKRRFRSKKLENSLNYFRKVIFLIVKALYFLAKVKIFQLQHCLLLHVQYCNWKIFHFRIDSSFSILITEISSDFSFGSPQNFKVVSSSSSFSTFSFFSAD